MNWVPSNKGNLFSHASGGQKSGIKASAVHVPSEGSRGGSFLPLPALGGCWQSWRSSGMDTGPSLPVWWSSLHGEPLPAGRGPTWSSDPPQRNFSQHLARAWQIKGRWSRLMEGMALIFKMKACCLAWLVLNSVVHQGLRYPNILCRTPVP